MFSFEEYEKLLELFEKIINYFRYFSKQLIKNVNCLGCFAGGIQDPDQFFKSAHIPIKYSRYTFNDL